MANIKLLDCTLRDGAYITSGNFGEKAITGIISKLSKSGIELIECGWLKNNDYKNGSTYYHLPSDIIRYIPNGKNSEITYIAMIDYNRYDDSILPCYDGTSIDAIRVVFPRGKSKEGLAIARRIRDKGYKIFLQVANTLGYSDIELAELINEINTFKPNGVSIVDTFGAMYPDDLRRFVYMMNHDLSNDIAMGFHSHNNQQLSFSLSMLFVEMLVNTDREIIVDSSLCGMGRGAGNTTTELLAGYLNRCQKSNYDLDYILDAIDIYIADFMAKYKWGYSILYFLSGKYSAHVNNIRYLTETHKTKSVDINNIFELLTPEKRLIYDYDNLERVFVEYNSMNINDSSSIEAIREELRDKDILLIAPGKMAYEQVERVKCYIESNNLIVIGVNSCVLPESYIYNYFFFSNSLRYDYVCETNHSMLRETKKIITSNIKNYTDDKTEFIINYKDLIKKRWKFYDNSVIMCLRLLNRLGVNEIYVAGLDGYNELNYAESALNDNLSSEERTLLNKEIKEMIDDYQNETLRKIKYVTDSKFENERL